MMYCIVDIETTGGIPKESAITEIAVLVHDGERVVKQFQTLLNPQRPVPYYITKLTGITNAMVANAPTFNFIAEDLFQLLNKNIFVAHNVGFDYSFISHYLKISGFELEVQKLCTVRLSRKIFPGLESYSLGKLCKSLEIDIQSRHRAYGDALATKILFEKLLAHGDEKLFLKQGIKSVSKIKI